MDQRTISIADGVMNKPHSNSVNRRIVLRSRPAGTPSASNFRLEERAVPAPSAGQVLLRTLYLSLDPYMRGRLSDRPPYAAPVAVGEVMVGRTVSRVETSRHPDYQLGDLVLGYNGWQQYALSDGTDLAKVDARITRPSLTLGALGVPGLTAYVGLLDIGKAKAGQTVVVAAASGAIASLAGQIAKLMGCRAVVLAGSADQRRFAIEELGFDACIVRRSADLPKQLAAACPNGIDVYFEAAGGAVIDIVLPLLNAGARVPLTGPMACYNDAGPPPGSKRLRLLARTLHTKRIKMQGFLVSDYRHRYSEFFVQMSAWLKDGKVRFREEIVDGLESAPHAFISLLEGKRFGKLVIRVSNDKPARTHEGGDENHRSDSRKLMEPLP
jgi:NADPH-dependent curcumin reductase